jgi:hypothetical protein
MFNITMIKCKIQSTSKHSNNNNSYSRATAIHGSSQSGACPAGMHVWFELPTVHNMTAVEPFNLAWRLSKYRDCIMF